MHTSYNDGRAIATTKTDPPLNNFQFNFANRKQNAILDYCESTAIASASHDSIYSMCNLLLLQVAYLFRRGRCLKGSKCTSIPMRAIGRSVDVSLIERERESA
ncbi:hypothetical protein T4B_12806 [Trichinella pseudospiralis]|uniref:Uncharacterized protein n=2 Tax=Trichinella pseudospiralis TaxID=6337 RepID=A0A0V1JSJ0_TRIPS|nr:hypothetical protein T4D_5721 [Trichinella pseudospiralis]KRZ28178.1 hypothetical protein T4B_12806 [Trichinella pseudospiralis]KRZ37908.1 hypothetical protein T4C_4972 [Trichinella pseudospiralis]